MNSENFIPFLKTAHFLQDKKNVILSFVSTFVNQKYKVNKMYRFKFWRESKPLSDDKNLNSRSSKPFLNKKNFHCYFLLSKVFSQKMLKQYLISLIKLCFVSFSKTNVMKLIDYDLFKFIVSSSDLNVSSEIEVFEAIINWIEHDESSRKIKTYDLLKEVRLPLLSSEIIREVIEKHSYCSSCQKCRNHIDSVLAHKTKSSEISFESSQFKNCYCMHNGVYFRSIIDSDEEV